MATEKAMNTTIISKETQEKNQEFRESMEEDKSEDIELDTELDESQWDFEKKPMTIRDAMDSKVMMKDLVEGDGVKLPMRWTPLIALVNRKRIKGPKLTLDSPVVDAIEAYSVLMGRTFFRGKRI